MRRDPQLRFENFIVGSANRLAVAAARAVADGLGAVYNPLVIYSGSGLGKTHLVNAIANQVAARRPEAGIQLVTLDEFVEQLTRAIAVGDADALVARYLVVDLLVIDDVQFLTGRPETQSALLKIFNALQAAGRQIVMTSDRPPADIADVDQRLLTRLTGGLIVDIGAPEYETRVAILRAKCEERGVVPRTGVVEEIGRLELENVRALQGALNRVLAYEGLSGLPVERESVMVVLADLADRLPATPRDRRSGEFQSFLNDLASAVSQHVDAWHMRLEEGIAYWRSEGYRTGLLDRALDAATPPGNLEALLRDFEERVARLRELERETAGIEPTLAAHEVFHDPERLLEAAQLLARAVRAAAPPPGPSPAFTRAAFEVSASNLLAARAADAVIASPGERYNPLFLHGPSGVGKTHLLNAVGNGLLAAGAASVAYLPAQLFVDELITALREGTVDSWRARFRGVGALLLDDVQFVAGKERTQEELFHVFNALHGEGKQIVFASDRPPRELTGLESRLRSRFEGGLVVAMQSPDRVLRERLYERFLRSLGVAPTEEMLGLLAEPSVSSVREIIGVANRIVASAEVASVPVTIDFVRTAVGAESVERARGTAPRVVADSYFLDREKLVWAWPDAGGRLFEELR